MKVTQAIAEVMKREGVEQLFAYPVNPVIESCAEIGIRPIIVRQERTGIHMADAISRLKSGRQVGVFACQNGPGAENAFGGIAQAFTESVPMVFLPAGPARAQSGYFPNFSPFLNYQNVTKSAEQLTNPAAVWDAMRRAFSQARNGRPGPVMLEIPADVSGQEVEPYDYVPAPTFRSAPDPRDVDDVASVLLAAERPVLYAGQGVHYARAWSELQTLAELLEIPVATSLEGKSAFQETHPLALGSGGAANPAAVHYHVADADVIFGVGCSFARTGFGIQFPIDGRTYVHATLDAADINKDVPTQHALVGDAQLVVEVVRADERDGLARADLLAADDGRDVHLFLEHLVEALLEGLALGRSRGVVLHGLVDGRGNRDDAVHGCSSLCSRIAARTARASGDHIKDARRAEKCG